MLLLGSGPRRTLEVEQSCIRVPGLRPNDPIGCDSIASLEPQGCRLGEWPEDAVREQARSVGIMPGEPAIQHDLPPSNTGRPVSFHQEPRRVCASGRDMRPEPSLPSALPYHAGLRLVEGLLESASGPLSQRAKDTVHDQRMRPPRVTESHIQGRLPDCDLPASITGPQDWIRGRGVCGRGDEQDRPSSHQAYD